MTEYERVESHEGGFPPFPHSLEIPSGLPHFHGLDGEIRYSEATAKTSPRPQLVELPIGTQTAATSEACLGEVA
jgi:hypothetical protein